VTPSRAGSTSILGIHFQELKYGHEGPGYSWVQHAPYRGKLALVEATLYGQDAIRSVQFELVDQYGFRLATPVAVRIGSGADSAEYWRQLEVPLQHSASRPDGRRSAGWQARPCGFSVTGFSFQASQTITFDEGGSVTLGVGCARPHRNRQLGLGGRRFRALPESR
jgi:hypothetical protein